MTSLNTSSRSGESSRSISFHSEDEQVSVIRKEFVELTGDLFSAVILNQLLYWTLRVKDFDLFLEEEKTLGAESSSHHGWVYKTAHDLIEETLLGISHPTMRKYLKHLIDQNWIQERAHPRNRWNKTTQYRINIRNLQEDLKAMGRDLPSIYLKAFAPCLIEIEPHQPQQARVSNEEEKSIKNENLQTDENLNERNLLSNENSDDSFLHDPLKDEENSNVRILHSNVKNFHSDVRNLQSDVSNFHSNVSSLHSYTYTENTTENKTENTNKEHTQDARANFENLDFEKTVLDRIVLDKILEVWKIHVGQEVHLTEERKHKLESLLNAHLQGVHFQSAQLQGVGFQSDLTQWEAFCKRIKSSPFLMGQGPRKWRVSFDWILCEENFLKVLEGNFDDGALQDQESEKLSEETRKKEISTVIETIQDPLWREWCSQLDFSPESRNSVSLRELKSIANARFLEVEDDRLVWIGSADPKVLAKIEELRLKLLPPIERTFPQIRMLRTRLDEGDPQFLTMTTNPPAIAPKLIQQKGETHAE